MKTSSLTIIAAFVLMQFAFPLIQPSTLIAQSEEEHRSQFDTIGHEILTLESDALPVTQEHFQLLDKLIEEASTTLRYDTSIASPSERIHQAVRLLSGIGHIMTRNRFRLRADVKSLSEALTHRRDRYGWSYYEYDCDTSSFIYLSIAEVMKLPISMVEAKFPDSPSNHNFVRWTFPDGSSLDWDTNGRFVRQTTNPAGFYGTTFVRKRVLAYAYFLRAKSWEESGHVKNAIKDYKRACQIDPGHPRPANNLAWMYVAHSDAREFLTQEEALDAAQRAVEIDRDSTTLDTLAAVHAELGDFERAIELQSEVMRRSNSWEYHSHLLQFRQGKTILAETDPQ